MGAPRIRLFLMLLFICTVYGCGVKGDPVVPHAWIPQPVTDLKAFSRNSRIVLQWSIPPMKSKDKKNAGLGGFRVWQWVRQAGEEKCPTCPKQYKVIADIDFQALTAQQKEKDRITFWDEQKKTEGEYSYQVTSYTTQGVESQPSNPVVIRWLSPLPAPVRVNTTSGDRFLELSWTYPSISGEKTDSLAGYNVYRRTGEQPYPLMALNPAPLLERGYRDSGLINGERYSYVVRTLRQSGTDVIESESSPEVSAMPEDRTAPAPPIISIISQTPEGVMVIWEPSQEPDLAGYRVYRRKQGETSLRQISPLITGETRFVDSSITPGESYYYAVTAVDSSSRQNESDFSQELLIETEAP